MELVEISVLQTSFLVQVWYCSLAVGCVSILKTSSSFFGIRRNETRIFSQDYCV